MQVTGGRSVREVLADLGVDPDTVFVIRAGELVTRGSDVRETDVFEVRPVISGGAPT